MYKILNDLSPLFMREMMTEICASYYMRSATKVEKDDNGSRSCTKQAIYIKTISYGLEAIRYLGPEL